jgi:hypothetical protein
MSIDTAAIRAPESLITKLNPALVAANALSTNKSTAINFLGRSFCVEFAHPMNKSTGKFPHEMGKSTNEFGGNKPTTEAEM